MSILLTLRIALRWKPDAVHPARDPGLRRFFLAKASEIIYELTGERRTSEQVHAHLRYLWNVQRDLLRPRKSLANTRMVLDDVLRETKRKVRQIQKDSNAVLGPLSAKSASAESLLQSIQDNASQLPAAVQADQDQDFLSLMDKPNATLNGDVNIFRELSRIVADDANDFDIHLATPVPAFHFSLTSVSRFYRIDALPSLASNISYDFGNELRTLHNFSTLFSPASQYYLKHIKINMVEGFMVYNETLPLISERSLSTYVNTSVANLRILDLDLWPRDPTRTDTESRAWGGQSEVLLQSLHNVNAKVRLDLRWAEDCERFEREYVRNGGWKRIRKEMPENRSGSNDRICHRCYELHGRADSEVGGHRGEQ